MRLSLERDLVDQREKSLKRECWRHGYSHIKANQLSELCVVSYLGRSLKLPLGFSFDHKYFESSFLYYFFSTSINENSLCVFLLPSCELEEFNVHQLLTINVKIAKKRLLQHTVHKLRAKLSATNAMNCRIHKGKAFHFFNKHLLFSYTVSVY